MADSTPNGIEEAENQSRIAKNKGKSIVEDKEDGFGGSGSGYGSDSDGEEDAGTGRVKLLSDVTGSGSTGKKNDARGMEHRDLSKISGSSLTLEKNDSLKNNEADSSSGSKEAHKEMCKEMRKMGLMLREIHNVVLGKGNGNGNGKWPKWLASLLMMLGGIVGGVLALQFAAKKVSKKFDEARFDAGKKFDEARFDAGKKFDEARFDAGQKFDKALLEFKAVRKGWESAGCPSPTFNAINVKFAFGNQGESSGSSKGAGAESERSGKSKGAGDKANSSEKSKGKSELPPLNQGGKGEGGDFDYFFYF